jgi:hypothetical protein
MNTNTNTNTNDNVFALILEQAINQQQILRLPLTYVDPVITIDGTTAERSECIRVGSNEAYPSSRYATWDYYTVDQLTQAEIGCCVHWIETRNEYYQASLCTLCENGEYEVTDDVAYIEGHGYLHREDGSIRTDGHGTYFLEGDEDFVYCEDDSEFWPRDECHFCDPSGEWVHEDESECEHCNPTTHKGSICRYHSSPDEVKYRGLSPFLIGFEIEKTSIFGYRDEGETIGEYDLIAGWELDGSCGVEGVTNCYDLLTPSVMGLFEQHVREANDVLAEPCDSSCGGHINVSWQGKSPRETLAAFKVYAPLWYALFRKRLNNTYCRQDKKIEDQGIKYSPVRCKSFGIELRLPSRVLNAKHLLRRARLIAVTCRAMEECWTLNRFIRESRRILLKEAYNGDRKRYAKALRLARHFRIWMLDGIVHPDIYEYTR